MAYHQGAKNSMKTTGLFLMTSLIVWSVKSTTSDWATTMPDTARKKPSKATFIGVVLLRKVSLRNDVAKGGGKKHKNKINIFFLELI